MRQNVKAKQSASRVAASSGASRAEVVNDFKTCDFGVCIEGRSSLLSHNTESLVEDSVLLEAYDFLEYCISEVYPLVLQT